VKRGAVHSLFNLPASGNKNKKRAQCGENIDKQKIEK
jgi:hypothetical protein